MGGMISYIMRNSVINQSLKCMKFRKIYQKKKKKLNFGTIVASQNFHS